MNRETSLPRLTRPIAIYYEHPRWFEPVFAELDRQGVRYIRLDAARHHFDISPNGHRKYSLLFNRMSPWLIWNKRGCGL